MWERRSGRARSARGWCANVREEGVEVGVYRPRRREARVVLPDPEGPTRTVQVPALRVRETFCRMGVWGCEG